MDANRGNGGIVSTSGCCNNGTSVYIKEEPELLIDDACGRKDLKQAEEVIKVEPEDTDSAGIKVEFISESDGTDRIGTEVNDSDVDMKYEVHSTETNEKFLIIPCVRSSRASSVLFFNSEYHTNVSANVTNMYEEDSNVHLGTITNNLDNENTEDCNDYDSEYDDHGKESSDHTHISDSNSDSVDNDNDNESINSQNGDNDNHKWSYQKLNKYIICICPICAVESKSLASWYKHLNRTHRIENELPTAYTYLDNNMGECNTCSACIVMSPSWQAKKHYLTHQKYQQCFICLICKTYKSTTLFTIRKHVQEMHIFPNSCIYCGKYLENSAKVAKHYMRKHKKYDDRKIIYICPVCGKKYAKECLWQKHCEQQHQMNKLAHLAVMQITENSIQKLSCKKCSYTFPKSVSALELLYHASRHMRFKIFKCKFCFMRFNSSKTMRCHICSRFRRSLMSLMKLPNLKYSTNDRYQNKNAEPSEEHKFAPHLSASIDNEAVVEEKIYKCVGCELAFSSMSGHRLHFCTSHPYLAKTYGAHCVKCLICHELYKDFDLLEQHINAVHASIIEESNEFGIISANTCRYCHRSYKTVDELQRHIKRKHTVDINNKIGCPECGQYFTKFNNLRYVHWRWEHSELPVPDSLLTPRELQQKKASLSAAKTDEHAQSDSSCEAATINKIATNTKLKSEQKKMTLYYRNMFKTFKCVACESGYGNQTSLSRHLHSEHPDIVQKYTANCAKCLLCEMLLQNRIQLEKHIFDVHANDDDNNNDGLDLATTCPMCHLKFKSTVRLEGHLKKKHTLSIHEKDICPECGLYFPSVRSTRNHWLRLHTDKMLPQKLQLIKKSERTLLAKS